MESGVRQVSPLWARDSLLEAAPLGANFSEANQTRARFLGEVWNLKRIRKIFEVKTKTKMVEGSKNSIVNYFLLFLGFLVPLSRPLHGGLICNVEKREQKFLYSYTMYNFLYSWWIDLDFSPSRSRIVRSYFVLSILRKLNRKIHEKTFVFRMFLLFL